MNMEFKQAYSNLDLNEKRNQLSNELMIIGELIKILQISNGMPNPEINIKNYDSANQSGLSENEMLDLFYEDIYNLERELFMLIELTKNKK